MTAAELSTAAQEGVKVNVAIINNGYLGMVRQWQEFFYERRYAATPLRSPDFVKLAEAHGLLGLRAEKRPEVADVVKQAREAEGTVRDRLPRRAGRQRVPDGAGWRRPRRDDPAAAAGAQRAGRDRRGSDLSRPQAFRSRYASHAGRARRRQARRAQSRGARCSAAAPSTSSR